MGLANFECIIKSWQISCRYVYIFIKSNFINLINHSFSFCEPKSSIPFVKLTFTKTHFTRLSSTKTKIVIDKVDGIWFSKDENIYLHKGTSWSRVTRFSMAKTPLQSRFTILKSKFFPAKFSFYKIQKKILAGKNILQKSEFYFEVHF